MDSNDRFELDKQEIEQKIQELNKQEIEQKIDELITMEFIKSLFPTDEEIEEMIEKYFKEDK